MEKAYCKKEFCISENKKANLKYTFQEGYFYNVYYSDNVYCWVLHENGMIHAFYLVNSLNNLPTFKDYFYTLKELRKIKISKIENNSV